MIDEDFDLADEEVEEEDDLENAVSGSKRDFRSEIEKKLELIQLRKLTGDYFDEEIFN